MNAVEKSLSSTAGAPSQDLAPMPPAGPAGGRPLDAWLLSKLSAFLGEPSLEFAIKDGARVSTGIPVARVTFANRATLLAVLSDPAMRFGDAYADGAVTIDGDLVSMLEVVYRAGVTTEKPRSLLRRALRRPRTNTPYRLARQHPSPLRHRQPVLFAVARQHDGLHVRVLPDSSGNPR